MKIFVYGTLKRGYGNNRLLQEAGFLRVEELYDYKLYNAGFPVAAPDPGSSAVGEVWDIGDNQQILHNLDRLESEGRMYHRVYIEDMDFWLYVGDENFWNGFKGLEECPKNNFGAYEWHGRW
jgi:gamma-glutamylcyclotransferase (GGCT)/AIG2-like uncharacterized protein YtfP